MVIEPYILILLIVETALLFIITAILLYKSIHVTKLYQQLSEMNDELEELSNNPYANKDFIPMLVHELRSPLSVIKGATDLLLNQADDLQKDQIQTLLSQIKESSGNLLKMVSDILDVSKMGAGRFEINKVFSNINDLVRDQCSYLDSLSKIKNISLECNLSSDLDNFSFDPDRIKQVMSNLLSNAIKFTPEGGIIVVSTKRVDGHVEVSVSDNGVGVSENEKNLLFKKFSQAHNQDGVKEKGSGLGLVIAKGIVEAHGGSIWVEDNKPKGSKFLFTLPL